MSLSKVEQRKAEYARARIGRLIQKYELAALGDADNAPKLGRARDLYMRILTECVRAQASPEEFGLRQLVDWGAPADADAGPVTLTPDQEGACAAMQAHFDASVSCMDCNFSLQTPCAKHRVFVLAGPAGSGKSTLSGEILKRYSSQLYRHLLTGTWRPQIVAMAAPTNKAALRMLQITGQCAGTYHSIAYSKPVIDEVTGELLGFVRREEGGAEIGAGALMIMDEASMADERIATDFLAALPRGVRVLVVGDPCQIPPVKGLPGFDLENPNWMLQTVHRQVGGMLAMVTRVREQRMLLTPHAVRSLGGEVVDVPDAQLGRALVDGTLPVLLTRTNRNRWRVNNAARAAAGFPGMEFGPQKGERVIAFSTNHALQIVNGEAGVVKHCMHGPPLKRYETWKVLVEWEGRGDEWVKVPRTSWNPVEEPWNPEAINAPTTLLRQAVDLKESFQLLSLQPAYALTTHKAQGSQWEGGAILLEGAGRQLSSDSWKLSYTQVSRFKSWVNFVRFQRPNVPPPRPKLAGTAELPPEPSW